MDCRWLDIVDIQVSGGHLDYSTEMESLRERGGTELLILLLNSAGKVSYTMLRCLVTGEGRY